MSVGPIQTGLSAIVMQGAAGLRDQLTLLTEQASSGKQAQDYDGLAPGAVQSALVLQPQVASLQALQNGINAAGTQISVTQSALSQISSIASNLYAQLNNLNGLDPATTDSIAATARQALQQVAGLLDERSGGTYVFAGSDTANAPVPNPDNILTSGFYTQISSAVAGLATNGASATALATLSTASSNAAGTSPFSASVSQAASVVNATLPVVATGAGQQSVVGIAASANGFVASTGTSTTGSYMRDIMRALATIGSLTSTQVSGGADVAGLVSDTRTSLQGAITALNQDAGALGDRQSALTALGTGLAATGTALKTQVSNLTDADMATVLSDVTEVQSRLEASYKLSSMLSSLTLAQYL